MGLVFSHFVRSSQQDAALFCLFGVFLGDFNIVQAFIFLTAGTRAGEGALGSEGASLVTFGIDLEVLVYFTPVRVNGSV